MFVLGILYEKVHLFPQFIENLESIVCGSWDIKSQNPVLISKQLYIPCIRCLIKDVLIVLICGIASDKPNIKLPCDFYFAIFLVHFDRWKKITAAAQCSSACRGNIKGSMNSLKRVVYISSRQRHVTSYQCKIHHISKIWLKIRFPLNTFISLSCVRSCIEHFMVKPIHTLLSSLTL